MRSWWQDSCDDITAVIMKLIENYGGPYSALCILGAIIFPIATIVAGTGYSDGWNIAWGIIHFLLFAIVAYSLVMLFRYQIMMTPSVRKILTPLGILTSLILFLGILNTTKPIAIIVGLILSQIGLAYIVLVGLGIVQAYGLALALTPTEDIDDAQKRSSDTWNQCIGIAAWECFAAWYIISLGQYMSIYTGTFVICASGVILYGGIAWGIAGDFGRKAVYYIAIAGVLAATLHTILVAVGYFNPATCTQATGAIVECTPYQLIYWEEFLSNVAVIHDHTLGWFIAITVVLTIGFMASRISGKEAIKDNVRLVTFVTTGIFFLVWFIWLGGYSHTLDWFIKLGQRTLPTAEVWHGVIRLFVAILIIPALAIRFQRGGFRGFTIRLLWIVPCVLLPWFLFENFLWTRYPQLYEKLGEVIDGFFSAL